VLEVLTRLQKALTPKALILTLVETLKPLPVNKAILLFDNVDSIQGRRLRNAVRQFARNYAKNVGEYAKILVCLRPENLKQDVVSR